MVEGGVVICQAACEPHHTTLPTTPNPMPLRTGGHYTADVMQADGKWLRFNDAQVSTVDLPQAILHTLLALGGA